MVRSWVRDPSPELARSVAPTAFSPPKHSPAAGFGGPERFGYDGKPRLPNFINGLDGQLQEARPTMVPVDTPTHTRFDFSSTGNGAASNSLAAAVAKSLNSCASLRSGRAKSATARSLVAGDTRYGHLEEPHGEHVGPGAYDTSRALPGVGPAPLDSHTSSSSPQRDPYRQSAPFQAPDRPGSAAEWLRNPAGPDMVYCSPSWEPGPARFPSWGLSGDRRLDVTDWSRTGVGGGRGTGPADTPWAASALSSTALAALAASAPPSPSSGPLGSATAGPGGVDLPTDVAGRTVALADRAAQRNPNGVAFSSKEPRLLELPLDRRNDVRPSRHASLPAHRGEAAHLGPGSYAPPVSPGGPKGRRHTYRLFVDPALYPQPTDRFGGGVQANAAAIVHAHSRGTGSPRSPRHGCAGSSGPAAGAGGGEGPGGRRALSGRRSGSCDAGSFTARSGASALSGAGGVARLGASSSFTAPFRSQNSGGMHWRVDSALARKR